MDYFTRYPFQYGFILFIRLIYILVGENLLIPMYRLVSFGIYSIAMVFTFKLCEQWFDHLFSPCGFLFITLFWYIPIAYTNYVYGFSIGLSCCLIAIYCYYHWIKKDSRKYLLFSLLLLLIAITLKPNYLIVLLAIIVHQLFIHSSIKKKIITIICVGLTIAFQSTGIEFMANVFDSVSVKELVPRSAWILTGAPHFEQSSVPLYDYTLPGYFNGYNSKLELEGRTEESITEQVNKDLGEMIEYIKSNPVSALSFYKDKLLLTWNNSDFLITPFSFVHYFEKTDSLNAVQRSYINSWYPVLLEWSNVGYLLVMVCFLFGVWFYRKDEFCYLFGIIIGAVFVYHFFAETKSSYIYPFITMVLSIAAGGIQRFGAYLDGCLSLKSGKVKLSIFIAFGILVSSLYNPTNVLEPIFECYSDGSNYVQLEVGHYYNIPFTLKEREKIDAFEIRLDNRSPETSISEIIHVAIIDGYGNNYGYYDLNSEAIPSYEWTRMPVSLELSAGEYYLQIFLDSKNTNNSIHLRTGVPYGEFDSLLIDQYPYEYSADIKIMQTKTYPIQFYGMKKVPGFDIMSRQPYAQKHYR